MFKLYVVWHNGAGYTKDVPTMRDVITELESVAQTDEPAVFNVTYLETPDQGPKMSFDASGVTEVVSPRERVGQSSIYGTKVRD